VKKLNNDNDKYDLRDESSHRPTWCEIDLEAIKSNILQIRHMLDSTVSLFVCLKGDAISCGATAIAKVCQDNGVKGLSFGSIDTAIACRNAGIDLPMLLYPGCLPSSAEVLERYKLFPTISSTEDVLLWTKCVKGSLGVFLKIDTGGLRAGALPENSAKVARAIRDAPNLSLKGVYGHAMVATSGATTLEVNSRTDKQIQIFSDVLNELEEANIDVPIKMFSSSETLLNFPEADFNTVEPGRLIMGIDFPSIPTRRRKWLPALKALKSRVVSIKRIEGELLTSGVQLFAADQDTLIGLVPIGWSDGLPKETKIPVEVLIGGKRVQVIGPIHSEMLRIDLSQYPECAVGDEVVFLGQSGKERISIEEVAVQWNTSVFDVMHAIRNSVHRVYVQ
jgi:alanine racemase